MPEPICIYHGNCADGFTAAWAVHKRFPDWDFHPGVYQDAPPDVTGRDVVLVDFSYKRPVLEVMAQTANSILILDHHKSAATDLAGYFTPPSWEAWSDVIAGRPSLSVRVTALFDMDRSGAGITWDYFHGTERPLLVQYVEDRDLWRFKLPQSREINAFIFAHDYSWRTWDFLDEHLRHELDVRHFGAMGAAIEKKHHKDVAELVAVTRRTMTIAGASIPVANIPYTLTSDAGHLMCGIAYPKTNDLPPFAACYWDTPDGRVFSLRSRDGGADVSEVAKRYGGGGHARAAGFRMPIGWEGDSAPAHESARG